VHLSFNVIGAAVWLTVFCIIKAAFEPVILSQSASLIGIAVYHSVFNVLCTMLMIPLSGVLEKLVCKLIPDAKEPEKTKELDERLLGSPALALNQCSQVLDRMAVSAIDALKSSIGCVLKYDPGAAKQIRELEDETDHLEDVLGTYLVSLTSTQLGDEESVKATEYMKLIGDYERIADHAVNILESAEEKNEKKIVLSGSATKEYQTICSAVSEILDMSYQAFSDTDFVAAKKTEPLEQVIDALKEELRTRHILRLQKGECSVDAGFIWSDLLTNLERVSDHCSNISGCVLDTVEHTMNIHENLRIFRQSDEDFKEQYEAFLKKYAI
jgi:phosphate:Na+ symporter